MRRRNVIVLTVLLITVITVLVLHAFGVTGTGSRMEFQTIAKGYYSGHRNQAYYVINDADKWADIWNQHTQIVHTQQPIPAVDFSKTTIIAVFMGQFNTGGYGIEIKEIIDTGLSIVVKVEKTYPGKGSIVTEAFSQPYHIVKVDKIDKYVIFDTFTRTIEYS